MRPCPRRVGLRWYRRVAAGCQRRSPALAFLIGGSGCVDRARILDDRIGDHPFLALEPAEETIRAACVACDSTDLLDLEQDHILVAIQSNGSHFLHVTGFLT